VVQPCSIWLEVRHNLTDSATRSRARRTRRCIHPEISLKRPSGADAKTGSHEARESLAGGRHRDWLAGSRGVGEPWCRFLLGVWRGTRTALSGQREPETRRESARCRPKLGAHKEIRYFKILTKKKDHSEQADSISFSFTGKPPPDGCDRATRPARPDGRVCCPWRQQSTTSASFQGKFPPPLIAALINGPSRTDILALRPDGAT
jgi:hypothetical protein